MRFLFLGIFALCCTVKGIAQPYAVGHTTATFMDSARQNREVACEIYYPADTAGENVGFSNAVVGKVPAIAFGHGFVMRWDAYQNIWEAVVPQGYIMIFPTTEASFSPHHDEQGQDLAFVLRQMAAAGRNPASLFFKHVDTMTCVMGHSMGGGSAFLASAEHPEIKALATLAPAETGPSAIAAAPSITIPALIFAGLNDCIRPPEKHQLPMYEALGSRSKCYIGIKGGSHCLMADKSVTCGFGEGTCKPKPEITRETQHAAINKYLLPWLDFHLKHHAESGKIFNQYLLEDTAVVYKKSW
jgi:pimeloyl-ACP methyl ester carboxylesterase